MYIKERYTAPFVATTCTGVDLECICQMKDLLVSGPKYVHMQWINRGIIGLQSVSVSTCNLYCICMRDRNLKGTPRVQSCSYVLHTCMYIIYYRHLICRCPEPHRVILTGMQIHCPVSMCYNHKLSLE